jgi:hypothetical protein
VTAGSTRRNSQVHAGFQPMKSEYLTTRARRLLTVSLWLAACASAPGVPSGAPARSKPSATDVERFFPLHDGDVLSYLVWIGESEKPEQVIFRVERVGPSRASLRAGDNVKHLALGHDGVRLLTGGHLLAPPLVLGAAWAGAAGQVRIIDTERREDVPAGQFDDCLVTREEDTRTDPPRSIVTSYCPDVGIVRIEVDDTRQAERFELRSFGPGVDIDAF